MAEYINDIYLNMKNLYLITLHQTTKTTNISQLTTSISQSSKNFLTFTSSPRHFCNKEINFKV